MSDKALTHLTIPRAKRGSKIGWPLLVCQAPTETASRLAAHATKMRVPKGDLVLEAVEQYLDREAA